MTESNSISSNLRLSQLGSAGAILNFTSPAKKILVSDSMRFFPASVGYGRLDYLIELIPSKCGGKIIPDENYMVSNSGIQSVLDVLKTLNSTIDQTPPLEGPRRFGNMAFRTWHNKLRTISEKLVLDSFKNNILVSGSEIELGVYLASAFGSLQRLDYGTGHELAFLAFLGGLYFLKMIGEPTGEDWLLMFSQYLKLIQRLIITYNLEPAGSHGVWGLDDHFHLPYLLGSAQFLDFSNPSSEPKPLSSAPLLKSTLDPKAIQKYAAENLYFNCLQFIRQVKRGPFHEHSPMLFDVSAVMSWFKVYRGMRKMYIAEVLGKFPVVQHFLFGSVLFPWRDLENNKDLPILGIDEQEDNLTSDEIRLRELNAEHSKRFSGSTRSAISGLSSSASTVKAPAHDSQIVTKAPWAK
ncbi:Phosphotyrosyl phosphatase activator [Nadsonia fulvescens var. elongata DSM 6958]|uniref:Serine/threonine-protein phosphatase 2A activator n=1 Tax=Nadsonia fulvescens var. elongata DSM 6958 TaxID=857566 RepID=A0A1E3PKJ3_9ASCO|nr:Phosphotyrosyl phosphatase activator [Nadsonia fulvescens var. elongata DSM 6958]